MAAIARDNYFSENWIYLLAAFVMHGVIVLVLTMSINLTSVPVMPSQSAIQGVIIDNTAKRLKREKEQAEAERAAREKAEAEEKTRQQEAAAKEQEEQKQKGAAEEKKKADAQAVVLKKQADDKKKADAVKAQQAAKKKADQDARELAQHKAQLEVEMAAEAELMAAEKSSANSDYYASIVQKVEKAWNKPPTATRGLECFVTLTQAPGGMVVAVQIGKCNGDKATQESIQTAVYNAAPLPAPPDSRLFKRQITFNFKPNK